MWWRRSWFSLNGKVGFRGSGAGRTSYATQPPPPTSRSVHHARVGSDFQDRLDHTSFRAQPLAKQGGGVIETTAVRVQCVGWNLARLHLAHDLGEVVRL